MHEVRHQLGRWRRAHTCVPKHRFLIFRVLYDGQDDYLGVFKCERGYVACSGLHIYTEFYKERHMFRFYELSKLGIA